MTCPPDQDADQRDERSRLQSLRDLLPGSAVTQDSAADAAMLETHAPTLPATADAPVSVPPNLRISSYRILGVLGEGSMGIVYRAQQDNPYRVVALKVLKAGGASAQALERFEHEAQVLGRLQHPGIAQIFEAGTADTGYGPQPFFAMELIQGVALDKFAAAQQSSVRDRLALLVKVCDAVEHAHQKGVIHRDLKPGNILVDEPGQPKILDFGIALATDPDLLTTTSQADASELAGTPAYMSFEQVNGDASELDTRTDVYALGVIAYQLLAGRLPYDLGRKTVAEARRIIAEQPAPRLGRLDRALRGDIEAIVSKALEKDKARRYQSASDLATDLRRYLADEPILARPPSAIYQFAKFAKRNRALVGGAVGMLILLVVGFAGTSLGMKRAQRAEAKARAINDFLVEDLLAVADPEKMGKDVTVRQALDAAAKSIQNGSLAGQSEVEAAVRVTLGQTYRSLGLLDGAKPHLVSALETNRRVLGDEHPQTLSSMHELGLLLKTQGKMSEAEPLYRQALEGRRRVLGEEHRETLETQHNLALLLKARGKLSEAEPLYRRALEIQRRVLGEEDRNTLISMNNLALLLKAQGKLSEAEPLYRQTLGTQRRVLGEEDPNTLASMKNLAALLKVQGRLDQAQPLYRQVLETQQRVLGEEHPNTLTSINNLAALLHAQGRLAEAEPLYRQALDIQRRTLGDEHRSTLVSMNNLAVLLKVRGELQEAERLYRQTLETRRRVLVAKHPSTLMSMNNLAALLQTQGDFATAETLRREALPELRRQLGDDHPSTITAIHDLAGLLTETEAYAEAAALHLEALKLQRGRNPQGHPEVAGSLIWMGTFLMRRGDPARAEPLLAECVVIRSQAFPDGDWRTANARSWLGACLTALGRFGEAEPLLLQSYPIIEAKWEGSDEHTHRALQRIIELYTAWPRPDRAAAWRAKLPTTQPAATSESGSLAPSGG
ncbi:MAG: tetratricopeptide repeat protein [Planctomycetota bacterium]